MAEVEGKVKEFLGMKNAPGGAAAGGAVAVVDADEEEE